jgi:hypothetical protein
VLIIHQEDRDAYIRQQLGRIARHMGLGEHAKWGDEIRPGLRKWILYPPDVALDDIHLVLNQGVNLLSEKDWREVDEIMAAVKPVLTFVDTIISVMPGAKIKEYGEVSRAVDLPRRLARTHNSTMLCIHHSNKDASGSGGENLMDSQAFHAASEASLYAHKKIGKRKLPRTQVRWEREIKGGSSDTPDLLVEFMETAREIYCRIVDDDAHTGADGEQKEAADENAVREVLRGVSGHCLTQNKLLAALRAADYTISPTRLPKMLIAMPDVEKTDLGWRLIEK